MYLENPAWVIGKVVCHCTLEDNDYIRLYYQDNGVNTAFLIHRNKHREAAKIRTQRNMVQMKEQIKTPEKELHKTEISNLSDVEFKILVIRMLKELRTSTT